MLLVATFRMSHPAGRRHLEELDGWLPPAPLAYVRSREGWAAGSAAIPVSCSERRCWSWNARSTSSPPRPSSRRSPSRTGTPRPRGYRSWSRGVRRAATAPRHPPERLRAARARARDHRGAELPRVFPGGVEHRARSLACEGGAEQSCFRQVSQRGTQNANVTVRYHGGTLLQLMFPRTDTRKVGAS